MPSRILDPYGRPFDTVTLAREHATPTLAGVRSVWSAGAIASGLTPQRLASVLRAADAGQADAYLQLAEEMEERDPHYAAVLGVRKRALAGLEPVIEAASDAPADVQLADAVRALVRRPAFGDLLGDLTDALGKGYAVCEILWERGARWEPRAQIIDGRALGAYEWRDPRWFQVDRTDGRTLRLRDGTLAGTPLPPYKYVIHTPRLKAGLPLRGGLARLAAFSFMVKNWTLKDWLSFADTYGMPVRLGRYEPGTPEGDIDKLLDALANLGSDAAAAISKHMEIDLLAATAGAGGGPLFEGLAKWSDAQVSKGVLGQTMTTDDGASLSQAQVHDGVRRDLLKYDARQLAGTLARDLVEPYIALNFGPQAEYPRLTLPVPEPEDVKALTDALAALVPLGLRVEQSVIRDKLRLSDPAEGAELLTAPAVAPVTPPATLNRAANREAPPGTDALDALVLEALADWQPLAAPVVDPVRALAEHAQSFEDFAAGLPALLAEMDAGALVQNLAAAAFKARGMGDAKDATEG